MGCSSVEKTENQKEREMKLDSLRKEFNFISLSF